uniref:Uncharacterized protein n=1 Tax=Daphnia galeata TaxID=27404 RepID=A0A8J2RWC1_9CRUS|nr:unnamed protein product [Daphnia galeata]
MGDKPFSLKYGYGPERRGPEAQHTSLKYQECQYPVGQEFRTQDRSVVYWERVRIYPMNICESKRFQQTLTPTVMESYCSSWALAYVLTTVIESTPICEAKIENSGHKDLRDVKAGQVCLTLYQPLMWKFIKATQNNIPSASIFILRRIRQGTDLLNKLSLRREKQALELLIRKIVTMVIPEDICECLTNDLIS